jgi:hypothetical protein
VDHAGRKTLILAGTALQFVSSALVGWFYHIHGSGLAVLIFVMKSLARRSGDGRRAAVDQPRGRLLQPSRLDIWQDSREVILEPVLERSDVVLLDLCQP